MKKKVNKEKKDKNKKKEIKLIKEKPEKKPKKKRRKTQDKRLIILRYVTLGLAIILVVEGIYFGVRMYTIRKSTTYYSAINSAISQDDKIIAVGLSDSRHSKYVKYEQPGYNKPYIWVYDKNLKIEKEFKLDIGYVGEFFDIIEVEDGYVAVGRIEMTETNHKEGNSEGTIVKYNKDFKIVWRKNLDILGNTKLDAVKEMSDGSYLVVGSSVYASDVIGNHDNGGAIIVKYSKDGEKLSVTNYGGPKTGEFNDCEIVNDGIIVVGIRSSGTGLIFKYDFDGNEVWHNYYGYTDSEGLTSITKLSDNEFIVTGTKLNDKSSTDSYPGVVLKYDGTGKLMAEESYQKSKITKFNDSIIQGDKVLVVGLYGNKIESALNNDSIVITYTKDLRQEEEKIYDGDRTYTLNKIITYKNDYLLVGNTNSKIKEFKTNGLDYYPVLVK